MTARLEFKPEDFWVGVFWRRRRTWEERMRGERLDVWICLVPCFPIHIVI